MEPISRYEVRDELRRVLQSRHFAKARKRSRFLEFVCEQTLLGHADQLNEYLIGVEIYDRGQDFDPQADAIVRVQAVEIRRALKEYFAGEGKDDPWRIELPPGHYVPMFTRASEPPAATPPPAAKQPPKQERGRMFPRTAVLLVLALACAVPAALWLRGLVRMPASGRPTAGVPEAARWFWKPFLPPAKAPLIVIPVHPLLRAAHPGDPKATMDRSYLIPKEKIPEFRDTMHFRELEGFHFVPSTTDFTAVGETLGLLNFFKFFTGAGQEVEVKPGRLVDFESVKNGNAILLGGNQAWSGRIFVYPEYFWFHGGVITNKTPRNNEQAVYRPEFDPVTNSLRRDYALVLMLPNENREQRILLIYGIYTQGSQAAIEYVTNSERLAELRKELVALAPDKQTPPKYFQVLLSTTVENYVPGKVSLVSARSIPE